MTFHLLRWPILALPEPFLEFKGNCTPRPIIAIVRKVRERFHNQHLRQLSMVWYRSASSWSNYYSNANHVTIQCRQSVTSVIVTLLKRFQNNFGFTRATHTAIVTNRSQHAKSALKTFGCCWPLMPVQRVNRGMGKVRSDLAMRSDLKIVITSHGVTVLNKHSLKDLESKDYSYALSVRSNFANVCLPDSFRVRDGIKLALRTARWSRS